MQFAPVRTRPSGVPRASGDEGGAWSPLCPDPSGLRAGGSPLFFAGTLALRCSAGSSRSRAAACSVQAAPDAGAATRRRLASRAAGASSSCRSHTTSRPASISQGMPKRQNEQECPSGQPDSSTWGRPPHRAMAGAGVSSRAICCTTARQSVQSVASRPHGRSPRPCGTLCRAVKPGLSGHRQWRLCGLGSLHIDHHLSEVGRSRGSIQKAVSHPLLANI